MIARSDLFDVDILYLVDEKHVEEEEKDDGSSGK